MPHQDLKPEVELSAPEARRIVLAAQGFGGRRPAKPGLAHLRRLATRLHALQIDSVNVLARAHYLPAFSRLGPYPTEALDRLVYERRELFEYWGHRASFLPVTLHPLLRWRMDHHASNPWWNHKGRERRYVDAVLAEVAARGPISAAELSDPGERTGPWWGWAEGKRALEWLFAAGRVAVAGRRNFERLYDLTERVVPREVLDAPTPGAEDAKRELLVLAAAAFGVATAQDLKDYFHIETFYERPTNGAGRTPSQVRRFLSELVEQGRLVPVRVEGWRDRAYMHPDAKIPKAIDARTLVSPFDSLIWERKRMARLFDFEYRIEIYVPRPQRRYGYYVLPFLLGDRLVARVDLKADRKRDTLVVPGAFAEPAVDHRVVAGDLAGALREMAVWLGLDRIEVGSRGDLASPLRKAVGGRR